MTLTPEETRKLDEIHAQCASNGAMLSQIALTLQKGSTPPAPVYEPVPIQVLTGIRGGGGGYVVLGESRTFVATCQGFDPRATKAGWVGPDGAALPTSAVEVLPCYTQEYGSYTVYNVLAVWTPTATLDAGAVTFRSSVPGEFASMPIAVRVVAPPPQKPTPAKGAVVSDPENQTWAEPTDAEYAAGTSLPPVTSYTDAASIYALARVGRNLDGSLVRLLPELRECYDEIRKLESGEHHYFADECRGNPPTWGAQQFAVIIGKIFGFDYPKAEGEFGLGRAELLAGLWLQDIAKKAFFKPGGG